MPTDDVPEDIVALCLRARQAIADCRQARNALNATRAEMHTILDQLQQIHSESAWAAGAATAALATAERPTTSVESLTRETQAAHMIRNILDDFPLEMQITLLKALTMRTMVLLYDPVRRTVTLSA